MMTEVKKENIEDEMLYESKEKNTEATEKEKSEKAGGKTSAYQKLKEQNALLEEENKNLKDAYIRLLAEFDNFRRRKQSEALEAANICRKELLTALLPIMDDTERLFMHENGNNNGLLEGTKLIADKLRKTLSDFGLKPMNSKGTDFNPDLHEALMMVEAEDDKIGKVIDVYESGYMLGDEVIRYAKVIVGKAKDN